MSTPVAPCCLRKKSKPLSVMHDLASGCFCRWVSCSSLSLTSFQLHSGYPAISCFPASFMPYPRLATPPASSSTWRPHVCVGTRCRCTSTRFGYSCGPGAVVVEFPPSRLREFPPSGCHSRSLWDGLEAPALGCRGRGSELGLSHLLSVSSGHDLLGSRVRVLFILSISLTVPYTH